MDKPLQGADYVAPTRVLVCGSRHLVQADEDAVWAALDSATEAAGWPVIVIHGCAPGADSYASRWARAYNHIEWRFPAGWANEGKAAGPKRNERMLREGQPDWCIAFPLAGSKGTWDMVRRAEKAGVRVLVIE